MSFCCLLYHGVADRERWGYLSPDAFRRQLEWLSGEGFVVEGFAGLERRIQEGDVPARYAVATFDDGHRSCLLGAEILAGLAFQATFFVATAACRSNPEYLDEAGLRKLAETAEVGSHTVSHTRLTRLRGDRLRAELLDSKHWIEDATGREVAHLSAPLGAVDRRVVDTALECGYRLVGASRPAPNEPNLVRRHRVVNRLAVDYATRFSAFRRAVTIDPAFFRRQRLRAAFLKLPREMIHRALPRRLGKKLVRIWSRLR